MNDSTGQGDSVLSEPGDLSDGEIRLVLQQTTPADPAGGVVPAYHFYIVRVADDARAGRISLRVGHTEWILRYAGQIGYGVEPAYRGHRYAAKACRLLVPLARRHGLEELWITVNPDNTPSRRTCEILGAEMVEIVDVPVGTDMHKKGDRRKCRYRLPVSGG